VATSLETRIRTLEGGGGGGECPECGFDGDWSRVRQVWSPSSAEGSNRRCGTCGRPKRIDLAWNGNRA
jgi:endogenous inhibitor of DNA gyrase (YacG/DUF329 family)